MYVTANVTEGEKDQFEIKGDMLSKELQRRQSLKGHIDWQLFERETESRLVMRRCAQVELAGPEDNWMETARRIKHLLLSVTCVCFGWCYHTHQSSISVHCSV